MTIEMEAGASQIQYSTDERLTGGSHLNHLAYQSECNDQPAHDRHWVDVHW